MGSQLQCAFECRVLGVSCISHRLTQLAAFFLDQRAEWSTTVSSICLLHILLVEEGIHIFPLGKMVMASIMNWKINKVKLCIWGFSLSVLTNTSLASQYLSLAAVPAKGLTHRIHVNTHLCAQVARSRHHQDAKRANWIRHQTTVGVLYSTVLRVCLWSITLDSLPKYSVCDQQVMTHKVPVPSVWTSKHGSHWTCPVLLAGLVHSS